MRVLVCGSRDWAKKGIIRRVLEQSGASLVIQGDCRGADRMAADIARSMNIAVLTCPADWNAHGKAAGPIRNQKMLEHGPELVIAFHDDIDKSRGTKDMVARARSAGIPVRLVSGA